MIFFHAQDNLYSIYRCPNIALCMVLVKGISIPAQMHPGPRWLDHCYLLIHHELFVFGLSTYHDRKVRHKYQTEQLKRDFI